MWTVVILKLIMHVIMQKDLSTQIKHEHWMDRIKIQDFHRKYVLVPADKAANNVVVVWRLHYINTLKQELSGTKAYKETSEEEKSVVNGHCNHLALKFSVCVKERQDRFPTMYWLPKLHKKTYKARFIANSCSCTTTELSAGPWWLDSFSFLCVSFSFFLLSHITSSEESKCNEIFLFR